MIIGRDMRSEGDFMDYTTAKALLAKYKQSHMLQYYEELNGEQREIGRASCRERVCLSV